MKVLGVILAGACSIVLTSCASMAPYDSGGGGTYYSGPSLRFDPNCNFAERLPPHIECRGKKTILVDPRVHAWGAYAEDGTLLRAGIATAGAPKCEDSDRSCRTAVGTFSINSLGQADCKSSKYPKPHGGGLMPYCMFFHGGDSLHGSPDHILAEDNLSHGCVRMRIQDAEWVRYSFANIGTRVVVRPY